MGKHTAEGYLIFDPDIRTWGGEDHVYGVRIKEYKARAPKLASGEIAVKVKFTFDDEHLLKSIPVVEIDVTTFRRSDLPKVEII
jgi:hypothetical protein